MGAGSLGAALAACDGSTAPASSAPPASSSAAASTAAASAKPAASGASASAKPAASAGTATLKVAYVTTGGTHAPLWVAKDGGAFEKFGVKVEDQFIEASLGTKALIAKEVDVILQSAAPLITADLNGGAGIEFIGSVLNHSQFALLVAPSIKTASDLKGKAWATDKPGSTGDYQTRLLLKLLGLTTNDVVIRELGGNDIPLQALLSGQVQAAPM
ncbi:MAG TPA: ABC transporter substrate-binding protein, partial [Chloroflexota bacterium]|nr:ABC transporter substrate-binding protein [Chloroflexota bacterium]